jgi:hypothetical protein
MAGDVSRIQPQGGIYPASMNKAMRLDEASYDRIQVTQKAFDDFHLYDLHRTVALLDGETKQVQFIDASGVTVKRNYVYDGEASQLQPIYSGSFNQNRNYGMEVENTHVRVIEEIKNSESNHLGLPMPAGRVRLYRRDADGRWSLSAKT